MKRIIVVSCILFLLLFGGMVQLNAAQVFAQAGMEPETPQPEITPAQPVEGGGPGFTLPAQPIPHHRVGQPARSANATTQVERKNAQGETETVTLTGITALMAEGAMTDPLQGNYNIVKRDKILFADYAYASPTVFGVKNFAYQSGPPASTSLLGSKTFANDRVNAIAAGDLEGDLVDEQIAAYVDPSNKHFMISVGGLHGVAGALVSAPAAVGHPSGAMDVVARGYDDALWSIHYSGSAWGTWNNNAGFRMNSAPAAATRGEGLMDVFAVGVDNQLYFSQWNGSAWGSWTLIPGSTVFSVEQAKLPLQAVPGAAAVASSSTRLDVFRVALDHTLYQISSDDGGSTWGSWASLGGMLASAPAAAFSNNRMIVTALGMDGALWYRIYTGGAWSDWARLDVPAELAANPTPAAGGGADGYLEIFLPGKDNHVYSNVYFGTTWNGWNDHPMAASDHTPNVGAGVGAASLNTGPREFVTATTGAIYTPGVPFWYALPATASTLVFDTGLSTTTASGDLDIENLVLDVTTGYFSGDGRQQIVLGYLEAYAVVKLAVFDIHDGFRLTKVAGLTAGVTNGGYFPRVAAGDVDGDGLDEIGLTYRVDWVDHGCHLRVYNVDRASGTWAGTLSEIGTARYMDFDGGAHWFAGTLDIKAGDVVPEAAGSPNDEFVVLADWVESISGDDRSLGVTLTLFDNDPPTPADGWKYILIYHDNTSSELTWNEGFGSGAALAIGDLNGPQAGYGLDEIAVVWPGGFDGGDWPDIYEDIYIKSYKADTKALVHIGFRDLPGWSTYSYLDRIAIGDLDMDMVNEVVYVGHEGGSAGNVGYKVYIYEPTVTPATGVVTLADPTAITLSYTSPPRAFDLALGDFTGSGLKVGHPSYRVQNKMTTPVIFLNLPPMHQDIIKVGGVDTVVKVVNSASATHTVETGQTTVYASESKREWSLSTGFEMSAGGGGHKVKTSFDNTYGENFSNSEENITSYGVTDVNTANMWDKVVHNETHYAVYEYPVYGLVDGDGNVPRTISVVWPLLDIPLQTNVPASTDSNRCDEYFYAPGHQIYNAWSYDDNTGTPHFKDWGEGILAKVTSGGTQTKLKMSENASVSKSTSFKDTISAGLEYSYKNELKLPLIGSAFDFSFRAYAKGTYGMEEISTFKSTYNEQSEVVVDYPSASNMPSIRAYMYWAKGGYLVVDYQSRPDPLQVPWSYYDKPDPAFILPWYGFPDPAAPVAPLCGVERKFFSHDIVIEPAKASIGEMVKITATVRNFSDEDITAPVQVKFYQGDPDSGGTYLGQMCEIAAFGRTAGAKTCSIDWTVTGTPGESKIFAVIDPNNTITNEMHQAGDLINNNKGYGLLKIAGADYFDPGLKQQQAYQPVSYQQAPGLRFDLYLPTNNLTRVEQAGGQPATYESQSLLVEMVPTTAGSVVSVGKPFKLQVSFNDQLQTNFTFQPSPLGLMVQYRDADLMPGKDESALRLYRKNGVRWEAAECPGYATVRFTDQNRIAVPICQTGTYILSQQSLVPKQFFLPIIGK